MRVNGSRPGLPIPEAIITPVRANGSRPGLPIPEAIITPVRAPDSGCHCWVPTQQL